MNVFDPWSVNPTTVNPTPDEPKCCSLVQDPLKSYLVEKEQDIYNSSKLEKLFGEAWSEVPEKMLSELSLALENDQLDSIEAQVLQVNDPKSIKVLIHWVRQEDTIPGISLKYGINMEFLRRFNRLWPNDRRPLRPFIFIPLSLAPKLKTLSQEYPGLFYEVQATSLAKVSATLAFQEERSLSSSTCSAEDFAEILESSAPDALGESAPHPILVIPNCQLKYFPSSKRNGAFDTDTLHKFEIQDEASQYKTLEPLFPKGRSGYFQGQNLPDEIETQLLTQGKRQSAKGMENAYPEEKLYLSPSFRTWDLMPKANPSKSASQFFKASPITKSEPACSKDDSEFEMTLLSQR
ncbi:hypothetical protein DSO57_1010961 [Entomophthora muscae]|uniref:Uncharacterized protein n=1 Tax=Entomophthora muscae TaxID=34485 RepID=A0ACC2TIA6_9FUNG|nr:hypothetical protein DSO57_1010961 [Entomophthora muscae]